MTFEQFIEQSEAFKHLLYVEGTRNLFMKEHGVYKLQAVRLAYAVWEKYERCDRASNIVIKNQQQEIDQLKAELAQYQERARKDEERKKGWNYCLMMNRAEYDT